MPYPKHRKKSWFPISPKFARAGIIVYIMIITGLIAPDLSYSQVSKDRSIKYLRGRISNVNYTGSRITVKWLYAADNLSQNYITFSVPNNTPISSEKDMIFDNARKIGLVDLIIGNHVIIKYYADKNRGYPEAISVKVLDQDRPMSP
jgi:hypothetical protein